MYQYLHTEETEESVAPRKESMLPSSFLFNKRMQSPFFFSRLTKILAVISRDSSKADARVFFLESKSACNKASFSSKRRNGKIGSHTKISNLANSRSLTNGGNFLFQDLGSFSSDDKADFGFPCIVNYCM